MICGGGCTRHLVPARLWVTWPKAIRQYLKGTHARATSRGLCPGCYERCRVAGTLVDHERRNHSLEEIVEEYAVLGPRGEGLTHHVIAARLGMTHDSFRLALKRAKNRGLL